MGTVKLTLSGQCAWWHASDIEKELELVPEKALEAGVAV